MKKVFFGVMLSSALVAIGATASSKRVDLELFEKSGMEVVVPTGHGLPAWTVSAEQLAALVKNCLTDENTPPVVTVGNFRFALSCVVAPVGRAI